jgi:hypothetical protein
MTCLGSILTGPTTEYLEENLSPVFDAIMGMLTNDVARIRRTTAWVVSQMMQFSPRLVLNNEANLENLMTKMFTLLEKDGP